MDAPGLIGSFAITHEVAMANSSVLCTVVVVIISRTSNGIIVFRSIRGCCGFGIGILLGKGAERLLLWLQAWP
jgi:hypothetical protein